MPLTGSIALSGLEPMISGEASSSEEAIIPEPVGKRD
jgi:hypothetical protein